MASDRLPLQFSAPAPGGDAASGIRNFAQGPSNPAAAETASGFLAMLAQLLLPRQSTATAAQPGTPQAGAVLEGELPFSESSEQPGPEGQEVAGLTLTLAPLALLNPTAQPAAVSIELGGEKVDFQSLATFLVGSEQPPQAVRTDDASLSALVTELTLASAEDNIPAQTHTAPAIVQAGAAMHPTSQLAQPELAEMPQVLRAPPQAPEWSDELGARLTWMSQRGVESASLRLTPEHLGPLEIRIAVQDGEARVWFGAQHADTRAALEHSLPRLRELFAAQGMTLADAGVFRDPPREQLNTSSRGADRGESSTSSTSEPAVTTVSLARAGLLDTYA